MRGLFSRVKRVVFITPTLAHYRVPFHELVSETLAKSGVEYRLVYGQGGQRELQKDDLSDISWATKIRNYYWPLRSPWFVYQPYFSELRAGDFVIVDHENKLVSNYFLQPLRSVMGLRVALWGHGRNFQSSEPHGVRERWKRYWAKKADWWFTYTPETAALIAGYGFDAGRITTFYNSIDTSELRRTAIDIGQDILERRRLDLGILSGKTAIFVGGLYREKRLDFLLDACDLIHATIPEFSLLVVGGGPDENLIRHASSTRNWLRYLGPRFGTDKAELLKLSDVFLMPGLVGLAVLDCFAVGLPLVTTSYPYHSPEIGYLQSDHNGVIVHEWQSPIDYANAVVRVLTESTYREKLSNGAYASGKEYTIERMANLFCEGVIRAIAGDSN